MFVENKCTQLTLSDKVAFLPQYLTDILDKSWAKIFEESIFPKINEERFSVLYSEKASRPNSPINVIISLLIIKEIFGLSDEELIGSLNFDIRFQYALKTTSHLKQPVSINTLTNFRNRVMDYYNEKKIDLIEEEIKALSAEIKKLLKIEGNTARVDSFLVSSSCKKMSRIELVYQVNFNFVKYLSETSPLEIPEKLKTYLEKGNKNNTIYRTRTVDAGSKLSFLLDNSLDLYNVGLSNSKLRVSKEFKLLERMLDEQTNYAETKEAVPKPGKEIRPDSLQNPSDPDATYREKYGSNIGYVVNITEAVDKDNGVITDYSVEKNIYDDIKYSEKIIESTPIQEEKLTLLTDGAYYSHEISEKAKEKNIEIIPGEIKGRKPEEEKVRVSSFEVDKEKNVVVQCIYNQVPIETKFDTETNKYKVYFSKEQCQNCPNLKNCRIKQQKKYNVVEFSKKEYDNAKLREQMLTKEYINISNKRSGVEGIPSVMRRRYNVDYLPVRGEVCQKIWIGFKIAAYNFIKLINYVKFA